MGDYSAEEVMLIQKVSPHLGNVIIRTDVNAPALYRILAEDAFIRNAQGPEYEALRRACAAIHNCYPYRHTPEFNKLCLFS